MMAERQYLKNGRVKAIAVAMRERSALMPEVPTFDEAGLKGFEFAPWVGVVAPAGLPPAVSTRLAAALATVMADADTGKRLRDIGFVSFGGNGAEFASLVKREVDRYRVLVRQRDIKLED
jgi:tripartite-type tricarboxylate transporter receptor subunit TctC